MDSKTLPNPRKITTGDPWKNWQEFHEEWEDYEVATGVAEKSGTVRVATLKTAMRRKAVGLLKCIDLSVDDRNETKKFWTGWRNISS